MKFVAISDTHGKHDSLKLPSGDVLIHAGDVSKRGLLYEIEYFFHWFENQKFEYKIFIAGNHDFFFERETEEKIKQLIPKNIIYLNDNSTTINDVKIWGSPITPWFNSWAFNRKRGGEIKKHWDLIPIDTDILIIHGPVLRILDQTIDGEQVGCFELLNRIKEIKPKFFICGHIHEAYGTFKKYGIKFINASVLNEKYELKNKPIVFEI